MLAYLDLKTDKYRVLVPNEKYIAKYKNIIVGMTYDGLNRVTLFYGAMVYKEIDLMPNHNKKPEILIMGAENMKALNLRNYISKEYREKTITTSSGEEKTQRRYVGEKFDYSRYQEDLNREFENVKRKNNVINVKGFESYERIIFEIFSSSKLPFELELEKFEVELDYYIDYIDEEEKYQVFINEWQENIIEFPMKQYEAGVKAKKEAEAKAKEEDGKWFSLSILEKKRTLKVCFFYCRLIYRL